MRVLYLDHPEADFLATVVYMGLTDVFGTANIVDYPYKPTYHGQNYVGPVPCHAPGVNGVASPFPWMAPRPGEPWTEDRVVAEIRSFDLIVLASPRQYNGEALERILARTGPLSNLVFLDGEDYTTIRWDIVEKFHPRVYFKLSAVAQPYEVYHEAKARAAGTVRVVPFPLGSPLEHVEPHAKDLDVAFLGGGNWKHGDRLELARRLSQEFHAVTGNMDYGEYLRTLRRARVAVVVGGHGLEPLRTFETLACPGTLLMRERLDVITPYPFLDGETCILWNTGDIPGVVEATRRILHDEPRREQIAARGNAYSAAHFTPRARAQHLIEEAFR